MNTSIPRSEFLRRLSEQLPQVMADFLIQQRWFGGKARQIRAIAVRDIVPCEIEDFDALVVFIEVEYVSGPSEGYCVPLALKRNRATSSDLKVLTIEVAGELEPVLLQDALANESFLSFLLDAIANRKSFQGMKGSIHAVPTSALPSFWQPSQEKLQPSLMKAEQSNSSVIYGQKLVLKLFRRVEEGVNPDLEIGKFLTERVSFAHAPSVAGYLEYVDSENCSYSLGILQAFVHNRGDAWKFTLDALAEYYRRTGAAKALAPEVPTGSTFTLSEAALPDPTKAIGDYIDSARLLGQRTAELHLALNSVHDNPDFSPMPFRLSDQEHLSDSALDLLGRNFALLREKLSTLSESMQSSARLVLDSEDRIQRYFLSFPELKLSGMRSRIHGDYHLGQVLFTGSDFVIIDFEGEPARPLSERRDKRSPLQDIAGMLRSFHYAAYAPLLARTPDSEVSQSLGSWSRYWQRWVSAVFLKSYLATSGSAPYIPGTRSEVEVLLDAYMLDKAIYELGYELNNRPAWVAIPLEGISDLLESNQT